MGQEEEAENKIVEESREESRGRTKEKEKRK